MRFRSFLARLLALSFVLFSFPLVSCRAASVECSAASAILYCPASREVLYEKCADQRRPIASTTKIMTALAVLREGGDLDRSVTVPSDACGIEGTSLYLQPGETLSVRDLLYGLLLASANDAATSLALLSAGSVPAFAEKMNRIAEEIGLTNTHFTNPHGLFDPEHYSSARDLALLTAAAYDNANFREIVSTRRTVIPAPDGAKRVLLNHNKLLTMLPDCVGVKTGFTKKSGRCLVSATERDGTFLVCVTLNDPNDWRDHIALHNYGLSHYQRNMTGPLKEKDVFKDE